MSEIYKHSEERPRPAFLSQVYRYNILINGRHEECGLIGWRTALARARIYGNDLFEPNKVVEILNVWTGEIINLREAETRAAKYGARVNDAAISGTT